MANSLRKSRLLAMGAVLAVAAILPRSARAQSVFNPVITSITNTVSWTAVVDPSSTTAPVTYFLFKKTGINVNPLVGGTISTTTAVSFGYGGRMVGSFCFVIRASDTVSGIFNTSPIVCHSFLHDTADGNNNGIIRSDASGSQLGFNQTWNMSYFLDDDAYVVLKIFPPSETFTTDATTGFVTANNNVPAVKTVIDGIPRPRELDSSPNFKNTDTWDSRNSSGTTVSNGIYYAAFSVYSSGLSNGATQYANIFTIPVNIIRFTAFSTTGISPTVALANINYTITANSSVRVVVARPGRQFTIDGNGLVQALDATGTVIDTSTGSVVAVITGQRNFGANTEVWNGTDLLGVAVSTGVYSVGVSASDGSGNLALNLTGNNGPLAGTVAVDRLPAQSAPGGTAPSVSAITIGGTSLNLGGGTSVSAFSTINITLSATGGPATSVSLTGPNGAVPGGSIVVSGTAVTYSTTSVISATGTYTVTINPYDQSGANPGAQQITPFTIVPVAGPTVTAIAVSGTSLSLTGGTTTGAISSIVVTLSAAGGSATTMSLTGPLGAVGGGTVSISGTAVTYSTGVAISTTGVYSVTINPIDSTNTNAGTIKTVTFTVSASGTSAGTSQSDSSFGANTISYPNPAQTRATIAFSLAAASNVTIDIYTLTGRRVLHRTASYAAGAQTFPWTLVNDAGNSVANGIYNVHVKADNALGTVSTWKKIMVLK